MRAMGDKVAIRRVPGVGPKKLAGIAVVVLPCCGAQAAGCPGTLSGVGAGAGEGNGAACGGDEATGCPGTLSGAGG